MALTDVAIRNAKPGAKPIKMTDGAGLFLLITPAGAKLWRLKYRIDGREKLLANTILIKSIAADGTKWLKVFDEARRVWLERIATEPMARRDFRLTKLRELMDAAFEKGARQEAAGYREQAAKEMGNASLLSRT